MNQKSIQLLVEYKPMTNQGYMIEIPKLHVDSSTHCRRLAVAEDSLIYFHSKEEMPIIQTNLLQCAAI